MVSLSAADIAEDIHRGRPQARETSTAEDINNRSATPIEPPTFPRWMGKFFEGWGTFGVHFSDKQAGLYALYRPFTSDKDKDSHIEPALGVSSLSTFSQYGNVDQGEDAMYLQLGATYRNGTFDFADVTNTATATLLGGVAWHRDYVRDDSTFLGPRFGLAMEYDARMPVFDVAQFHPNAAFQIDSSSWNIGVDVALRLSLTRYFAMESMESEKDFGIGASLQGSLGKTQSFSNRQERLEILWEAFWSNRETIVIIRIGRNGGQMTVTARPF